MKISLILGLIFIISNQPIIIIGILILLVIIYSFFVYYEWIRFWFGYILILVILSGVLVVFTYVVRLIPNERFEFLRLVYLVFMIIWIIMIEINYIIMIEINFISNLLWDRIFRNLNLYLVIFLLRIIIIVIYVRIPNEGALRLI